MIPKVSVVMASYNHGPFVGEAIRSVLSQSFTDLELVITDDGSRDDTAKVARGFVDSRIKFHAFEQNRGACVAMNDAIRRSSGQYVAVLNSDDYFLPGKLGRQVAFLDAHPKTGAVFGLPRFVDETGRALSKRRHSFSGVFTAENRTRREWLRRFFSHGNCLCHPTVMLRRSCYDVIGLFDPLLMQLPDLDMWVRLCLGYEIHILPEELTAFRVLGSEGNVSAPALENRARAAWEHAYVLKHYAAIPDAELRDVFSDISTFSSSTNPKIELALEAVRAERPGYLQFGLALLEECIRTDSTLFRVQDYFRLVGKTDPYGVRFSGLLGRSLVRSRVFAALDRVVKRLGALRPRQG